MALDRPRPGWDRQGMAIEAHAHGGPRRGGRWAWSNLSAHPKSQAPGRLVCGACLWSDGQWEPLWVLSGLRETSEGTMAT